jgi:hypothetical protein
MTFRGRPSSQKSVGGMTFFVDPARDVLLRAAADFHRPAFPSCS